MKNIIIASEYGINSIGDEAMLHALVNGITSRLGSIALTIFSRNAMLPFYDADNPGLWNDVADRMKNSRDGVLRHCTMPGVEITELLNGMNWKEHADNNLWPAIEAADLLVVGGGSIFHDANSRFIYGPLTVYPFLIMAAKSMGIPVVVAGVSIGPMHSRWGKQITRVALEGCRILVRDRASQVLLHELGIESEALPDLSLALDPVAVRIPMEGQLLAVAPIWTENSGDWMPDFIKGVGTVARETGLTPALIPHCTYKRYPMDDDTNICSAFMPYLTSSMLVKEEAWDPEITLGVYGCCAGAITIRLHGTVFAARMGIPFAPLSYWPKVDGFCEWYDVKPYPLEGSDWVTGFLEKWGRRDEEAARLRERTEELRAKMPRYWDVIEEAINAGTAS